MKRSFFAILFSVLFHLSIGILLQAIPIREQPTPTLSSELVKITLIKSEIPQKTKPSVKKFLLPKQKIKKQDLKPKLPLSRRKTSSQKPLPSPLKQVVKKPMLKKPPPVYNLGMVQAKNILQGEMIYPRYPRSARKRGYQGLVKLKVIIKNGELSKLTIQKSSGYPLLDRAAKGAIRKWNWQPQLSLNYIQKIRFGLK